MVHVELSAPAASPVTRRRALLRCAVALAAGLFAARTGGLPAQALGALVLVAARVAARRWHEVQPWAIGLGLGALLQPAPAAPAPAELKPPPGSELFRLDAEVEPGGQWDPDRGEWRGLVRGTDVRFRLTWVLPPDPPRAGNRLQGLVRRAPPAPALCPEDREGEQRAERRAIVGTLIARGRCLTIQDGRSDPRGWAEAVHQRLASGFTARLGQRAGALVCRLTLGSGPPLGDADQGAHSATGLAHLLAVSGFHAVLVAAMVDGLLRRLRLPGWLHSVIGATLLSGYALLTGLQPPVVRSVGALLLREFAFHRGLPFDAFTALAATTLLTAALDPEDLGSASFLLSYAAVAGLLLWGPPILGWLPRRGPRLLRSVLQAVALSCVATLATSPLTLWLFGQATPWSIVATPLLTLPVAALIVAGFGLGALDCAWPAAAELLAAPVRLLGEAYLDTVAWFAQLPGAPVHAGLPTSHLVPMVTLVLTGLLLLCRPRRGPAAVACALVTGVHLLPLGGSTTELRLFPVGHGLSCLVRTADGPALLVDCGSLDRSRPERLVIAALRRLGVTRLDDVVVTHADADHAGSVAPILYACAVGTLWLPTHARLDGLAHLAQARRITVRRLVPGSVGRTQVGLFAHAPLITPTVHSGNDAGLWVAGDLGGSQVLLLGDHEEAGIAAVLAARPAAPCDVLLAPHHGRPCAMTGALLEATQPDLVLVSDGWKFSTSPEELLYRKSGAACLRTALCGEIALRPHGEAGLMVETFRPVPSRPLLRGRVR